MFLVNQLLPKCYDCNKQPKRPFLTLKIDQFLSKTGKFRYFFKVKNVVNFTNSSRQYLVKIQYQQYAHLIWD